LAPRQLRSLFLFPFLFFSLSMCLGGPALVQQPLDSLWRDPPVWITNLALKGRAPIVLRCSPLSMLQPRDSSHRS
jgi:hypothetical protein